MAVPSPQEETKRIAEAQKLAKTDAGKAESIYKDILSKQPGQSEAAIKNFETALVGLGELYRDQKRVDDLAVLIRQTRSALSSFAKAKTSKLGLFANMIIFPFSKLTKDSPPTPRTLHNHSQYHRSPDLSHEIMHRMGRRRTPGLSTPRAGVPPCDSLHGQAILL